MMNYDKQAQQGMPQGQGQKPQMQPAPQGGQPEEISGAQRVSNTEFNQDVQNILLSRIEEEGTKNPNFGQALDAGITKEGAMELALILPELMPVFRAMGLFDELEQAQNSPIKSAPQMAQPQQEQNPLMTSPVSKGLMG